MAPRKRKLTSQNDLTTEATRSQAGNPKKRLTKADRERIVCKSKLETLEQEESLLNEDRLTQNERNALLNAYNKLGFQVFQDMQLLQQFLPNRTERDLKGLIERLKPKLQQESPSDIDDKLGNLDGWSRLCQNLVTNFAKDKRVNLDNALADSLMMVAREREINERKYNEINIGATDRPDYPELLRSFSQLLMGRFPNMTPANARISLKLFEHITDLVSSLNLDRIKSSLEDGHWLQSSAEEHRRRREMAQLGLDELNSGSTLRDFEKNLESKNVEALCLELPKIKRITELLNPLNINESLLHDLMNL